MLIYSLSQHLIETQNARKDYLLTPDLKYVYMMSLFLI